MVVIVYSDVTVEGYDLPKGYVPLTFYTFLKIMASIRVKFRPFIFIHNFINGKHMTCLLIPSDNTAKTLNIIADILANVNNSRDSVDTIG